MFSLTRINTIEYDHHKFPIPFISITKIINIIYIFSFSSLHQFSSLLINSRLFIIIEYNRKPISQIHTLRALSFVKINQFL